LIDRDRSVRHAGPVLARKAPAGLMLAGLRPMRRAERLFRLVSELRGRRLAVTAGALAEALEVSVRTIYRDVAALQASGVPVEGEAGVGYVLDPRLRAAAGDVRPGGGAGAAGRRPDGAQLHRSGPGGGGGRAEAKIRAILDDRALAAAEAIPYRAPIWEGDAPVREVHRALREAAEGRRKLALSYVDAAGAASRRVVHPLGLMAWRRVWTLLAWCELRDGYRNFRMDRIEAVETLDEGFETGPERSLRALPQGRRPRRAQSRRLARLRAPSGPIMARAWSVAGLGLPNGSQAARPRGGGRFGGRSVKPPCGPPPSRAVFLKAAGTHFIPGAARGAATGRRPPPRRARPTGDEARSGEACA
jgi:predicted DNA-binding transcriptional regulator YafY